MDLKQNFIDHVCDATKSLINKNEILTKVALPLASLLTDDQIKAFLRSDNGLDLYFPRIMSFQLTDVITEANEKQCTFELAVKSLAYGQMLAELDWFKYGLNEIVWSGASIHGDEADIAARGFLEKDDA